MDGLKSQLGEMKEIPLVAFPDLNGKKQHCDNCIGETGEGEYPCGTAKSDTANRPHWLDRLFIGIIKWCDDRLWYSACDSW
jgi:hypothetical protein